MGVLHVDIADKFAVKQLPPGDRKIDPPGLEKRLPHLSVAFYNFYVVEAVGAAPDLQLNMGNVAGVAGNVIEPLVDRASEIGGGQ